MEEKVEDNEVTSTQKSLSSNHDPGWNDPPKWAFVPPQKSASTPSKRLLNKRVAFPLTSGNTVQNSNPDRSIVASSFGNLPPPPIQASNLTSVPHAPLIAPSAQIDSGVSDVTIDKNQALSETLENLEALIGEKSDGKSEEVKRRLESMKMMWREDKLNDVICQKVLEISKALRNNEIEGADKIHVSLIMEHAALCSTWISGIRHIILGLREKSSQQNSISGNEGFPYLLPNPANDVENE